MRHYQRVVAEIDLDAIKHNYQEIKKYLPVNSKVCGVIKADGYGHGSVPIAKTLNHLGIDAFAVAASSEAVILRKNAIDKTILVLGYTSEEDYMEMVQYGITQTVFRLDMAKKLSDIAMEMGLVAHVHILIDTGMGRIGFMPDETSVSIIKEICDLPFIAVDGLFSHFSRADEIDKEVSEGQIKTFNWFVTRLEEEGIAIKDLHLANSAGFIDLPHAHFDMVRVGIAMYGLYPSDEVNQTVVKLKPALSLKSNVILVKELPEGQSISYGGTFVTNKTMKIATIPVGYGDGYPRALSSKGSVLIRGKKAPILGRVCMDQFMVDVTDIEGVSNDDEVVLIGRSGDERISVEDIAAIMGTINYEVVCQLGKRIPRVYLSEGKPMMSIDYF